MFDTFRIQRRHDWGRAAWLLLAALVPLYLVTPVAHSTSDVAKVAAAGAPVTAAPTVEEPTAEFTDSYLAAEENVALGEKLWQKQCRHCHGASAYPGKAPKLKPRKYTPDFVYDRVSNGFRKMPAWKTVFSKDERMAIVAYVKSRSFSP